MEHHVPRPLNLPYNWTVDVDKTFGSICHHYCPSEEYAKLHLQKRLSEHQLRPTGFAEAQLDNNKFEIKMDVQHFTPDELFVHFTDNGQLVIEGKHEEKDDTHGYVTRHIKRRYEVPNDVQEDDMVCTLSYDGILMVSVPRKWDKPAGVKKTIPIVQSPYNWTVDANKTFGPMCHHYCPSEEYANRHLQKRLSEHQLRPTGFAEAQVDNKKFEVKMDVQHFSPDELIVHFTDNGHLVIEGKHEEKQDNHGYVTRHIKRRYEVPNDAQEDDMVCTLSSDGILVVSVPRKWDKLAGVKKTIPIVQTHVPRPLDLPWNWTIMNKAYGSMYHHYCPSEEYAKLHLQKRLSEHQLRPNGFAEAQVDNKKFEVKMDVQHFSPDELIVHFTDNGHLVIEGKHEEKQDHTHGYVTRHIKRRYEVPRDVQDDDMVCSLSSDGILVVSIPRKWDKHAGVKMTIPIVQTHVPHNPA